MNASLEEFLNSIQGLSWENLLEKLIKMKKDEMTQSAQLAEQQNMATALAKDNARLKKKLDESQEENKQLKAAVAKLSEQNAVLIRKVFGRQSEKMDYLDDESVTEDPLAEEDNKAAAEVEATETENSEAQENQSHSQSDRPRTSGSRKTERKKRSGINLDLLPADHNFEVDVDRFDAIYGQGWQIVNWHTTRKVEHVEEINYVRYTHVPVIKSADGILHAVPFGDELRKYSIATSSLVASIMYRKIFLGIPLYRQETDLAAKGFPLSRLTMSNWLIYYSFVLFGPVYDHLWNELRKCPWTQHDETTLRVINDGRKAGSKSFMWVHKTSELYEGNPIVIFAYELTRGADHLREYFQNYTGTMTSDAYSGYYSFAGEHPDTIELSGCLMHARRPFALSCAVKEVKAMTEEQKAALPEFPLLELLGRIFHIEKEMKVLSADERLTRRNEEVRPLIDEYFTLIHSMDPENPDYGDKLKKGIQYSLNHEPELRKFLEDGHVPCDNGDCERYIRPFATSRKTWMFCNTVDGAKAIAILYTMVETARANQANIYLYLKYLLDTMPKHMNETDRSFLADMTPWSQAYRDYEKAEKQRTVERFKLNPCATPPHTANCRSGPPGALTAL